MGYVRRSVHEAGHTKFWDRWAGSSLLLRHCKTSSLNCQAATCKCQVWTVLMGFMPLQVQLLEPISGAPDVLLWSHGLLPGDCPGAIFPNGPNPHSSTSCVDHSHSQHGGVSWSHPPWRLLRGYILQSSPNAGLLLPFGCAGVPHMAPVHTGECRGVVVCRVCAGGARGSVPGSGSEFDSGGIP